MQLVRLFYIGLMVTLLGACTASKPAAFHGTDLSMVDWGKDVTLTAHTGERVSTAAFRGKVTVLFFGYTHCPDICAPTLVKLAAARKALGSDADKVQVLFITVDPKHDTPEQLAKFVPKFDPSFIGLSGTPAEIGAVAAEYKVAYAPTPASMSQQVLIDHSGGMLVKDATGKLRLLFKNDMPVAEITADLRQLLKVKG
ncbi:MAG: SCO family protein [Gammaproteobacteria bacterium]